MKLSNSMSISGAGMISDNGNEEISDKNIRSFIIELLE